MAWGRVQPDSLIFMNDEIKKERFMETFSLVGTREQLDKYATDMAKIGWKLRYVGHSGSWLGEPIYDIIKTEKESNGSEPNKM